MTRYEKIRAAIDDEMPTMEIVQLHNRFCEAMGYDDNAIYSMDDFNELLSGSTPWDVASRCFCGDFRPNDSYFWFNGYANLVSFEFWEEASPIDADEIAQYIDENSDALGNDEIQAILDEEV